MRHEMDRRQFNRLDVSRFAPHVTLVSEDGKASDAQLLDISLGGARVAVGEADAPWTDRLHVLVDHVELVAVVAWRTATEVGLRYVDTAGSTIVSIIEAILRGTPIFADR